MSIKVSRGLVNTVSAFLPILRFALSELRNKQLIIGQISCPPIQRRTEVNRTTTIKSHVVLAILDFIIHVPI